MSNNFKFISDVTMQSYNDGVIASNHRVYEHIWLNDKLLISLLSHVVVDKIQAINMTKFTNIDGLLSDPTCIDYSKNEVINFDDLNSAVNYLQEHWILHSEYKNYEQYLDKKTSILDKNHLGTFHQKLGFETIIKKRQSPEEWWYNQKFDSYTGEVKDTLYKYVQENFINNYLIGLDVQNRVVLDFGCGSGMASRKFINYGAKKVYGVDPDISHLEEAVKLSGESFIPFHIDINTKKYLETLSSIEDKIDFVWMADVFHFYFYSMDGNSPQVTAAELLMTVSKKLKVGGKCIIMMPHGVFWLAPWLGGDTELPFTVLTEYSNKLYSVVPTLSQLAGSISSAKMCITNIFELYPSGCDEKIKSINFANEFPLWWVFECEKK